MLALPVVLGALLSACGAPEEPLPPGPDPLPDDSLLQSQKSRILSPNVSPDERRRLADGNSSFALALYERLAAKSDESFFYSPFSLSSALSMTYAGARGSTETQMASTLRFALDQSQLHPAFDELDLTLASRGQGAQGSDGKGFRLRVANSLWGQKGYNILTGFLDTLAQYYGAGLRVLNFKDQPDLSRQTINSWVAQQTEDKIPELLQPDDITKGTRMVLTNTIYFNAAWDKVFPAQATAPGDFHRLDGKTARMEMMTLNEQLKSASGAGWQAVELPYDGRELSMLVIVPDAGQLGAVEAQVCKNGIGPVVGALQPTQVNLTLPKWKLRTRFNAKEELRAMGMTDAFEMDKANFTGMNGGVEQLWIGGVIHEAFISVDEKGTEAAAATAVVMVGGAMPPPPLVVDRPFIFVIRDNPTGSILFVGRVTNPA